MTFDLVIIDLTMPCMDSVALAEAIRKLNPATVVIWITGYRCGKYQAQAASPRVHRCLEKPVRVGALGDG